MLQHWARVALIGTALFAAQPVNAADTIRVALAIDRVIPLPASVATVVIGNPLIADATVVASKHMVITGKSYGATNIIVLDKVGTVLVEHNVEVRGPEDLLVVHCAISRQTFHCTPLCQPRDILGDTGCTAVASTGQKSGDSKRSVSGGTLGYNGPCENADDVDAKGSRCGGRAASERPGGKE